MTIFISSDGQLYKYRLVSSQVWQGIVHFACLGARLDMKQIAEDEIVVACLYFCWCACSECWKSGIKIKQVSSGDEQNSTLRNQREVLLEFKTHHPTERVVEEGTKILIITDHNYRGNPFLLQMSCN